jgi:hypothetical protein
VKKPSHKKVAEEVEDGIAHKSCIISHYVLFVLISKGIKIAFFFLLSSFFPPSLHAEFAQLANACTVYEKENRDWEQGHSQETEKGHGLRESVSSLHEDQQNSCVLPNPRPVV